MPTTLAEREQRILDVLGQAERSEIGEAWLSGQTLQQQTRFSPAQINDAVTLLVERGLVQWRRYMGTVPFVFGQCAITSRGRYELEQMAQRRTAQASGQGPLSLPATPIGSPFGFNQEDWEFVADAKLRVDELRVVLGYQTTSSYYNTRDLNRNVEAMFQATVNQYNELPNVIRINFVFVPLAAGYGEHLFNAIAREIIASDIAVFETSDLNPNVMLEMGVALTWGTRVFPIKLRDRPTPPSDISGQTYADYTDSAREFVDPHHQEKLLMMVRLTARRKGSSGT